MTATSGSRTFYVLPVKTIPERVALALGERTDVVMLVMDHQHHTFVVMVVIFSSGAGHYSLLLDARRIKRGACLSPEYGGGVSSQCVAVSQPATSQHVHRWT